MIDDILIPSKVLSNFQLTPSEKLLFGVLWHYERDELEEYFTVQTETLSSILCATDKSVDRWIQNLKTYGFLEIKHVPFSVPHVRKFKVIYPT